MKIIRAKVAGFCFGVQRAVEIAEREAGSGAVQTLGPLIHNPEVLENLSARGVSPAESVAEIAGEKVIIRAHGVSDAVRESLAAKNLEIVDASCPFVQRLHAAVADFVRQGVPVIVVGRADHPEMAAVCEDFPQVLVVENPDEIDPSKIVAKRFAVLAQTTEKAENLQAVIDFLETLGVEVLTTPTICNATTERQNAALELAENVDLLLVVGGRQSNNTKNLFELVADRVPAKWIENETEIDPAWLEEVKAVGITAGASTPESTLLRVEERLAEIGK